MGLTDDNVLSLLEDREGSLWIGTASGLDQLRDTKLTTFSTGEGLPTNRTKTAIATRDGAVEVFTDSGGLVRIKDGIATPFAHNDKLASLSDSAIYESRDGSLWLGTWHGLSRIQGDKVTVYNGDGHFYQNFVSAISEDDEGLIVTNSESLRLSFQGRQSIAIHRAWPATPSQYGIYVYTIYHDHQGDALVRNQQWALQAVPGE